MMESLEHELQGEAEFFDKSAHRRTVLGQIPMEADIRRATRFRATSSEQEPIDPLMSQIVEGYYRDRFIDYVSRRKGGRVLDICCGPGWLSLELGRRGQYVDAYDLSPKAILLAQRMLDENPFKEGFGCVQYHLEDVTNVELGENTLDAVSGWSAFHHLPGLTLFMERVKRALTSHGIVATMDDLPRRRLEIWLERFFRILLPTYDRSYRKKIMDSMKRILGVTKESPPIFTPMEAVAAKDEAVFELADYLYDEFDVLWDVQFNAFAATPSFVLIGPDWFRYGVAKLLMKLDTLLCRTGICKGSLRIVVAQKPPSSL